MRFKLCPVNDFAAEATQTCLNKYPVQLAEDSRNLRYRNGHLDKFKYSLSKPQQIYQVKVMLPSHLTCDLCVLQWMYRTGEHNL